MGIWIELGVFLLVFVFAAWQFHDLKREKAKRLAREAQAREAAHAADTAQPRSSGEPLKQSEGRP